MRSDWIKNEGGMPVDGSAQVEVRFFGETGTYTTRADYWNSAWKKMPADSDMPSSYIEYWRLAEDTVDGPAPADKPPGSGDSPAAAEFPALSHEDFVELNYQSELDKAKEGTPFLDKYFGVQETLQERGSRYGDFTDNAAISQHLKQVLQHDGVDVREGWRRLSLVQREALEMIVQKVARILNGDPNYKDNWHDIQGYARLAEERCK